MISIQVPVDCIVTPWTEWTNTGMGGEQARNRTIEQVALNGGKKCPRRLRQTRNSKNYPTKIRD